MALTIRCTNFLGTLGDAANFSCKMSLILGYTKISDEEIGLKLMKCCIHDD